jgi:hypothetical protein
MIEAMGLKMLHRGPFEWHYLRTKFHENLPTGSKVISGVNTDRQARDLISLPSFLESRLKKFLNNKTGKAYCLLRTEHSYCVLLTYCPDRQECPANLLIRGSHQQSVPYFSFLFLIWKWGLIRYIDVQHVYRYFDMIYRLYNLIYFASIKKGFDNWPKINEGLAQAPLPSPLKHTPVDRKDLGDLDVDITITKHFIELQKVVRGSEL